MAKNFTTTFDILGNASGLVGAAKVGANALRGLKDAANFKIDAGNFGVKEPNLRRMLDTLQRAQAAVDNFKRLSAQPISNVGFNAHLAHLSNLRSTLGNVGFNAYAAQLRAAQAALAQAGVSTRDFASSQRTLRSMIDEVTSALKREEAAARVQNAMNAHSAASDQLSTAWGNMSTAIDTARQIVQPFKSAVDNAETFEHAISRVKALTQAENIRLGNTDAIREQMAALESQARELGATTQFTMTQAADAMGYLGMAGWKAPEILQAMPNMLAMAAASGADLARTADVISDDMTAIGMKAAQSGHFADVYAYALTNSNLNLEALHESMKYAAPMFHAYGSNLHEAAAAMMILGNSGIKGSMAGTSLRMGLLRISGPPSKKAAKALDAIGMSMSDATKMAHEAQEELNALGIDMSKNTDPANKLSYVVSQLADKLRGATAEQKLQSISAIFGVNAASGWMTLVDSVMQNPEAMSNYVKALEQCDGTAQQVAQTMNDDTRGAWLYLESAIDAVSNSIGSALLPALKSTYEALNPIVTSFAEWIGEHPQVVQGFAAIAAAAAAGVVGLAGFRLALAGMNFASTSMELLRATAAFRALTAAASAGGVASGVASLSAAFSSVTTAIAGAARAAMAFAFTPLGAGIAALAIAAYMIYQNWGQLAPFFENLWARVSSSFRGAGQRITAALQTIKSAFVSAFGGQANLDRFLTRLTSFAKAAGTVFMGLAMIVADAVAGIVSALASLSVGDFGKALNAIKETGASIGDTIMGLADGSIMRGTHTFGRVASLQDQRSDEAFTESQKTSERQLRARIDEVRTALPSAKSDEDLRGLMEVTSRAVEASTRSMEPKLQETLTRTMAVVEEKVKTSESSEVQARWTELSTQYRETSAAIVAQTQLSEKLTMAFERAAESSDKTSTADAARAIAEATAAAKSVQDQTMLANTLQRFAIETQERTETSSQRTIIEAVRAAQHEMRDRAESGERAAAQERAVAALTESVRSFVDLAGKAKTSEDDQAVLSRIESAITQSRQVESAERHAELGAAIQQAMVAMKESGAPSEVQAALSKLAEQQSQVQAQTQMIGELRGLMERSKGAESVEEQRQLMASLNSLLTKQTAESGQEAARLAELMSGVLERFKPETDVESKVAEAVRSAIEGLQTQASTQMIEQLGSLLEQARTADEAQQVQIAEQISALTQELAQLAQNPAMQEAISSGIESLVNTIVPATEFQAQMLQALSEQSATASAEQTAALQAMGEQTAAAAAEQTAALQAMGEQTAAAAQEQTAAMQAAAAEQSAVMQAAAAEQSAAMANLGAEVSASSGNITGSISSAAAQISGAISSISINVQNITQAAASNAIGGIYPRGAFLTTFAERSPEAAIPIDRSRRAVELWQRTGAMLGVYSGEGLRGAFDSVPEYNRIDPVNDDLLVQRAKLDAQMRQLSMPMTSAMEPTTDRKERRRSGKTIWRRLTEYIETKVKPAVTGLKLPRLRLPSVGRPWLNPPPTFPEQGGSREVERAMSGVTEEVRRSTTYQTLAAQGLEPIKGATPSVLIPSSPRGLKGVPNLIVHAMGGMGGLSMAASEGASTSVMIPSSPRGLKGVPNLIVHAMGGAGGVGGSIANAVGRLGGLSMTATDGFMSRSVDGLNAVRAEVGSPTRPMSFGGSTFTVNVTVNVAGAADGSSMEEAARGAFEAAGESFRRQLEEYEHLQRRRSFA